MSIGIMIVSITDWIIYLTIELFFWKYFYIKSVSTSPCGSCRKQTPLLHKAPASHRQTYDITRHLSYVEGQEPNSPSPDPMLPPRTQGIGAILEVMWRKWPHKQIHPGICLWHLPEQFQSASGRDTATVLMPHFPLKEPWGDFIS